MKPDNQAEMGVIGKIKKIAKEKAILLLLIFVLILLFLYIGSRPFRCFLSVQGIDSGFVIGFLTVIALLLSIIQNILDRRFSYNSKLVESIEDKGFVIIGKLMQIKQKSDLILKNLVLHQNAMKDGRIAEDANNTLTKSDIENGMELAAAYVMTYFPNERGKWNQIQDKLSITHTHNVNVVRNYIENIQLIIQKIPFKNVELDNLDKYIQEAKILNDEIEKLAVEITEAIVKKINEAKGGLKKDFHFRF